jgi:hypothetical protein
VPEGISDALYASATMSQVILPDDPRWVPPPRVGHGVEAHPKFFRSPE